MTKVSVIVPVYNVEQYLEECLISLMNQTFKEFEVIAINDGSTDSSSKILEKYKNNIKNMRIFEQINSGLSAARNKGIKEATGKYILFLDSDDMLEETAIEKLYCLAEKNTTDLVIYDALAFDDITGKQNVKKYSRKEIYDKEVMTADEYFKYAHKKCIVAAPLHFYKLDLIKKYKLEFKEGILHEDELFSMISYQYIKKVGYINEKLYLRRYRQNSIMTGKLYENKKSLDSYKYILKEFSLIRDDINVNVNLKKLINIRCSLLLSNLVRYKNVGIKEIIKLSDVYKIKIKWIRVLGNLLIYRK